MEKQPSVKKLFKLSFWITILLLLVATFAYGVYSVQTYARQILGHNASSLEKYTKTFSEDLDTLRDFNRTLVYSNPSFQLLSLNSYADSKRVVEQYNLRQVMLSHTPSYGVTMLYDSIQNAAYFVHGNRILVDQKRSPDLYHFLHMLGQEPEEYGFSDYNTWFISSDDYDPYLIIANNHRRSTLFSCFNIRAYLERNPVPDYSEESTIVIFAEEEVLIGKEFTEEHGIGLSMLMGSSQRTGDVLRSGYFFHTVFLEEYSVGICVITPVSALLSHVLPQIAFLFLIILLVTAIIIAVYRVLRRVLVLPLQEIAIMSQQLENEEDTEGSSALPGRHYQEFTDIKNALTDLRDNIVALELEKREKESEKEHAHLQYFQLQTRSHFFLNCLKSLYSMLENGEYGRMKNMILGFSNHLRYIFHVTMTVVTLESELKEVNDYHRLILMDSSRILLLRQEVPTDLLSYTVPPLIIQTFLENTYKYNDKTGAPLSFHIQVSRVHYNDREYLQIHCSDNGCGYSPEVLEKLNGELSGTFDQYNVGINNLRRRMSIVYKNNFHTAFYNLPTGGACSVIFVPIITGKEPL